MHQFKWPHILCLFSLSLTLPGLEDQSVLFFYVCSHFLSPEVIKDQFIHCKFLCISSTNKIFYKYIYKKKLRNYFTQYAIFMYIRLAQQHQLPSNSIEINSGSSPPCALHERVEHRAVSMQTVPNQSLMRFQSRQDFTLEGSCLQYVGYRQQPACFGIGLTMWFGMYHPSPLKTGTFQINILAH